MTHYNHQRWAKISIQIFNDPVWGAIKQQIKTEKQIILKAGEVMQVFLQYCLSSNEAWQPIDVRTLKVERFNLVNLEVVPDIQTIDILNQYFIEYKLLTKRYTLTNFAKWNANSQSETQSISQTNAKYSQSETQSRKVYQTSEYYRLQRLKQKAKSVDLTALEEQEIKELTQTIAKQKTQSQSETQNIAKSQSETQSPTTPPIEKRREDKIREESNSIDIPISEKLKKSTCREIEKHSDDFDEIILPHLNKDELKKTTTLRKTYKTWIDAKLPLPGTIPIHLWIVLLNNKKKLTERAIGGEVKTFEELRQADFNLLKCIEVAVVKGWQSVQVEYFKNMNGMKNNTSPTIYADLAAKYDTSATNDAWGCFNQYGNNTFIDGK